MLTEPVECKSCGAVSVNGGTIHCHHCCEEAIEKGFIYALEQYGIWNNGVITIGCLNTPIHEVIERFREEGTAKALARRMVEEQNAKMENEQV